MLLNVGPDAYGNIPPESLQILSEIGAWMKKNSKSVYGCGLAGIEKPDYGRVTRNGNLLYYHMFENTMGPVPLTGIKPGTIKKIRLLCDGSEVPISDSWVHTDYPDIVFANLGPNPVLPDAVDTVLEVELTE